MIEEKKDEKKEVTKVDRRISELTEKCRKNPWIVSTLILLIVSLVFLYFLVGNKGISPDEAASKLMSFAKDKGINATLVGTKVVNGMYEVTLSVEGQELPLYVTKDGKFFTQMMYPLDSQPVDTPTQTQTKDVPKSDKPAVNLFVMTHCPYGTQAEKGIIPVFKLLENKINGNIRFVHYFMHGDKEEQETYTQLCIREQQKAKYLDYLSCFLEDGDSARCLTKVGINNALLTACLANNASQAKQYYAADSELSQNAGVQGSPTLVINGVEASSGRSSSAFLGTICSAFNNKASECSQTLSSENPSAGFGYSAGTASSASCG
jgi:protein-disulfide isomerase